MFIVSTDLIANLYEEHSFPCAFALAYITALVVLVIICAPQLTRGRRMRGVTRKFCTTSFPLVAQIHSINRLKFPKVRVGKLEAVVNIKTLNKKLTIYY